MPDREDPPREQRPIEPEILGPETVVHEYLDFQMDFADPTSQGEVVVAPRRTDQPMPTRGGAAQVPGQAPMGGRMATVADVREIGGEAAAAIGAAGARLMENLRAEGPVTDDVSDEQAMAYAAESRRAFLAGARALQIGTPTEPVVLLPGNVSPREAQTLPAILNHTPAVRDQDWQGQSLPTVAWLQVFHTPGYMQEYVRALGRSVFTLFPCFAAHQHDVQDRTDALGGLTFMANMGGQGPSRQHDLDEAARWVVANGVAIDAATLHIPQAGPDYEPRVVLAVDADQSYLLVEEREEWGGPVDSMYIYSWPGGAKFYANNLPGRQSVERHIGGPHDGVTPATARPPGTRRTRARRHDGPHAGHGGWSRWHGHAQPWPWRIRRRASTSARASPRRPACPAGASPRVGRATSRP